MIATRRSEYLRLQQGRARPSNQQVLWGKAARGKEGERRRRLSPRPLTDKLEDQLSDSAGEASELSEAVHRAPYGRRFSSPSSPPRPEGLS